MKKTLLIIAGASLIGVAPLSATDARNGPQIRAGEESSALVSRISELFLLKAKGGEKDKDKDKDKDKGNGNGKGEDKDKDKDDKGEKKNAKPEAPKQKSETSPPAPPSSGPSGRGSDKGSESDPKGKSSDKGKGAGKGGPMKEEQDSRSQPRSPDPKPKGVPSPPVEPPTAKPSGKPEMKVRIPEQRQAPKNTPQPPTGRPTVPPPTALQDGSRGEKPGNRKAADPPSEETAKVLQDRGHRDRQKDVEKALRIDDRDQASDLFRSILGQAVVGQGPAGRQPAGPNRPDFDEHQGHGRLPIEQVGRTTSDRQQAVEFLIRRFATGASLAGAPQEFQSRRDVGHGDDRHQDHQPYYHGPDNRHRVVCYQSRNDIPAILLASVVLNRVQAQLFTQSSYRPGQPSADADYYRNIPQDYQSGNAYAVSYAVDPNSVVSREDILFQQGTSAFADAYSYDLVVDLAEAMKAPELRNEKFVIEGHASAEGNYDSNLRLSQERAERIARDLVNLGVAPDQLLPVGYGEAEAEYPGDARESLRTLDRRVMVFRMADE